MLIHHLLGNLRSWSCRSPWWDSIDVDYNLVYHWMRIHNETGHLPGLTNGRGKFKFKCPELPSSPWGVMNSFFAPIARLYIVNWIKYWVYRACRSYGGKYWGRCDNSAGGDSTGNYFRSWTELRCIEFHTHWTSQRKIWSNGGSCVTVSTTATPFPWAVAVGVVSFESTWTEGLHVTCS